MLSDGDVERIASRVAELLTQAHRQPGYRLVSARELASILGVSCNYVYANSDALGARRLGAGPKGRLRFDPVLASERLERIGADSGGGSPRRPPRDTSGLPVYDLA